jgi:sec-independent protein translocase protein TatA
MTLPGHYEWIIILVIVLILFGAGRIAKIAGEFGGGIRAFREGLRGPEKDTPKDTRKKEEEPTSQS